MVLWEERLINQRGLNTFSPLCINQVSDVSSIIFIIISCRLRELKTLYFYFCKIIKKKIETIFAKNFSRNWLKKYLEHQTLGRLSQQPSVLYWRLLDFKRSVHSIFYNFLNFVPIFRFNHLQISLQKFRYHHQSIKFKFRISGKAFLD